MANNSLSRDDWRKTYALLRILEDNYISDMHTSSFKVYRNKGNKHSNSISRMMILHSAYVVFEATRKWHQCQESKQTALHLVALITHHIFNRLQTGNGSYLLKVNLAAVICQHHFYLFMHLFLRSKKTGTNVWHFLCSPVLTAQIPQHYGFTSMQTFKMFNSINT